MQEGIAYSERSRNRAVRFLSQFFTASIRRNCYRVDRSHRVLIALCTRTLRSTTSPIGASREFALIFHDVFHWNQFAENESCFNCAKVHVAATLRESHFSARLRFPTRVGVVTMIKVVNSRFLMGRRNTTIFDLFRVFPLLRTR